MSARVFSNLWRTAAACTGVLLMLPSISLAVPPVAGTVTTTEFCGTVFGATTGMTNHGVVIDDPYVGTLRTVQRDPDTQPSPNSRQWDCDELSPCGTYTVQLQQFAPPQTEPVLQPITGPLTQIDQDIQTYRADALLDDFVTGPAELGAFGIVDFQIFCGECGQVNDFLNIAPNFKDFFGNIVGHSTMIITVPGIGGSLAPPEGNTQTINMNITRLGGACNNILPATSSKGLVGLVGLMVLASLFFAGKKRATA